MKRAALAFLLVVALPLSAADKWWDSYNKGVAAVNSSNYKAGADALQKAIAEMPTEGVGVRTRNQIITYVPHFWLGIAKFNLGDVDGAIREWQTSEEQGAISKTEYYSNLKNWMARAQAEKKRTAQSAASGAKKAASDAIGRAVTTQMDALSAGGDRTDSYRSALRMLQDANAQFNKGGTDISAYDTAAEKAKQAGALFAAAADEGKKLKASRPPIVAKKPAEQPKVERIEVEIPKPAPAPVQPKPEPPAAKPAETPTPVETQAEVDARLAVQQYRRMASDASRAVRGIDVRAESRQAESLRQQLSKQNDEASLQRITRAANDGSQAVAKKVADAKAPPLAEPAMPEVTPSNPVADLRSAYRAFAAGDLVSSEDLLTKMLQARPTAEAYLLRGCARYTRAMLSRTPDSLLPTAAADFKAALAQNRSLRLDSRAFSPKLIAYFEQLRKSL